MVPDPPETVMFGLVPDMFIMSRDCPVETSFPKFAVPVRVGEVANTIDPEPVGVSVVVIAKVPRN